jgi:hypothetical protein
MVMMMMMMMMMGLLHFVSYRSIFSQCHQVLHDDIRLLF